MPKSVPQVYRKNCFEQPMLKTDLQIRKWKPTRGADRASCGNSLYIRGNSDGSKVFQFRRDGKWIRLGDYPYLTFEQARAMVPVCKRLLKANVTTLDRLSSLLTRTNNAHELEELARSYVEEKQIVEMITFDEAFDRWYELQLAANRWTHFASKRKPISFYTNHAKRHIGNLNLDQIRRPTIKAFMQPLFLSHTDTASNLLGYIWEIMEQAYDDELIENNPCPRQKSFTVPRKEKRHAQSLPFDQLPELWEWIESRNFSIVMKTAMKLTIVTAHRAAVIAYMRKEHYDTDTGVWTVPKKDIESGDVGYMKSGREFAFQIPKSLRPDIERLVLANTQSDYVFTLDGSRPIHPESLTKNFKQFGEITTHGFRNTFKTWCLNNNVDHFLADRYVDHALLGLDKNYRRDDLFKQRAELAERYLEFVRA